MKGRGGFRQGAGRKAMWENGETQTIRVPVAIKDELMNIGQQLDQGQRVIAGQTCIQLQQLLAQWEAKAEVNQGEEWENIRQLISEIKGVLAQRPMRGQMRGQTRGQMRGQMRGNGQGKGNCHRQQNRQGCNSNFADFQPEINA